MAREHRIIRVKICGITRRQDARAAVRAGAHALGFVFHPSSPRSVTPQKAASIISILPPFITAVGVFVNLPKPEMEAGVAQSGIHAIQLHGDESDCRDSRVRLPGVWAQSGHGILVTRSEVSGHTRSARDPRLASAVDDTD